MLASVDFNDPLFWAVLIAWILSVVLHEFAHGLVAYWGGDWSIRERGGLTLNPLQYVDPLMSLIIPAVMLLLGGIPLPGGVTYVRHDLLKGRVWESAVSLAGPMMNLLLFLACAIPLHPRIGWADYTISVSQWSNGPIFLATMATLQLLAVMFNLVPIPPLDGFGAISPFLNPQTRSTLTSPQVSRPLFFIYFAILFSVPQIYSYMMDIVSRTLLALGFGEVGVDYFYSSFLRVMAGK